MKMYTEAANSLRDINEFVNRNHIPKEHIVNIFESHDGTFMLVYFAED